MERYTKRLLKQKAPVLAVAVLIVAALLLRGCSGQRTRQDGPDQSAPAAYGRSEICALENNAQKTGGY